GQYGPQRGEGKTGKRRRQRIQEVIVERIRAGGLNDPVRILMREQYASRPPRPGEIGRENMPAGENTMTHERGQDACRYCQSDAYPQRWSCTGPFAIRSAPAVEEHAHARFPTATGTTSAAVVLSPCCRRCSALALMP